MSVGREAALGMGLWRTGGIVRDFRGAFDDAAVAVVAEGQKRYTLAF